LDIDGDRPTIVEKAHKSPNIIRSNIDLIKKDFVV